MERQRWLGLMAEDKFEIVARVPRNATSEMLIKKETIGI